MLNDEARAERLATGRGLPLRFIAQAALPAGIAYETHIAETGAVPTRHNLHDFFNALVWFAYPRIKAALNARQAAAIDAAGVVLTGTGRGGKAQEEALAGRALEPHVGKRARKGRAPDTRLKVNGRRPVLG